MTQLTDLPIDLQSLITSKLSLKDHIQEMLKGRETNEVLDTLIEVINNLEVRNYNKENISRLNNVHFWAGRRAKWAETYYNDRISQSIKTMLKEAKKTGKGVYVKNMEWSQDPRVLRVNKCSIAIMFSREDGHTWERKISECEYDLIEEVYMK
jgi:hypothetical protein